MIPVRLKDLDYYDQDKRAVGRGERRHHIMVGGAPSNLPLTAPRERHTAIRRPVQQLLASGLDMNVHRINPMKTRLPSQSHAIPAVGDFSLGSRCLVHGGRRGRGIRAGRGRIEPEGRRAGRSPLRCRGATRPPMVEPPSQAEEAASQPRIRRRSPKSAFSACPHRPTPSLYTRGLPYGSLWLTFHGLQWPYMPAAQARLTLRARRISGWGWVDTSYEKFAPWGHNPTSQLGQDRLLDAAGASRLPGHAHLLARRWLVHPGPGRAGRHRGSDHPRSADAAAPTPTICGCASASGTSGTSIGRFEGWEVFHLGMGLDLNTFERGGAFGPVTAPDNPPVLRPDRQSVPSAGRGRQRRPSTTIPAAIFASSSWARWAATPAAPPSRHASGGHPRPRLAQAQGGSEYQTQSNQDAGHEQDRRPRRASAAPFSSSSSRTSSSGSTPRRGRSVSIDNKDNDADPRPTSREPASAASPTSRTEAPSTRSSSVVGSVYTHYVDQNNVLSPQVDDYWQVQNFAAIQYVVFQQLYIKLVAGYARGHWQTDDTPHLRRRDVQRPSSLLDALLGQTRQTKGALVPAGARARLWAGHHRPAASVNNDGRATCLNVLPTSRRSRQAYGLSVLLVTPQLQFSGRSPTADALWNA